MAPNDSEAFVDSELERLQVGLRQLKVQYDMFFAGSLPRQPHELRADLERIIKRLSGHPIRKYSQRFHLASLVSRFNAMSELWTKTLRTLEADGFVVRTARPVVPPHVEYSLTDRGREVGALLHPLMSWIAEHADAIVAGDAAGT